jgi:hypothetical protein
MNPTRSHTMTEELAHRENDGLEVALLWHRDDDTVAIDVHDTKCDVHLLFPVPRDRALDAFNHPFLYAPAEETYAEAA